MLRFARVLTAVLLAAPIAGLSAQANGTLRGLEGKKVRLSVGILEADESAGSIEIRGTVFEVRSDSIHVLQAGGQALHIPVTGVRSLQVSSGKDHWRGARNGALAGAGFGMLIVLLGPPDCNNGYGIDCRADGSKPTAAEYAWDYVSSSAVIGAMIGAMVGTERWEQVITRPQRVTIAPARGGGIRLGLSF